MTDKARVNLYLDRDLAERAKTALDAVDSSLSEFVNNMLEQMLPSLEVAASGGNKLTADSLDKITANLSMAFLSQGAQLGDLMRTLETQLKEMEGSKE